MASAGIAWLEQKVPEFALLPENEKSEIIDFSLLWSFFEGTILNGKANVPTFRTFVGNLEQNGTLDQLDFNDYWAYLRKRYLINGDYSEYFHYLYVDKSGNPPEVHQMLKGQSPSKAVLLIGCLIVIYRLRNNLFHGEKWRYQLQDQYANFRQANSLLIKLMN